MAADKRSLEEKVRLAKQMTELLINDLDEAVAISAVHNRAAFSKDVPGGFSGRYEAHGYNVVLYSLHVALVMSLMRIFDNHEENTASLSKLSEILDDEEVISALAEETKASHRSRLKHYEGPPISEEFLEEVRERTYAEYANKRVQIIREALNTFKAAVKGHHIRQRLTNLRNERYAHTAIEKKAQQTALWGDADKLLELTITVVEKFRVAVLYSSYGREDGLKIWNFYASTFWHKAAQLPGDRPKKPKLGSN